jgi:predicted PurR-regulated permease PerM
VVLAICFYPIHRRFERCLSRGRAALMSTTSVAVLLIIPMLAVASPFVSEVSRVLDEIPRLVSETPALFQHWLRVGLSHVPGGETIDAAALLADPARRLAAFVSGQAAAVLRISSASWPVSAS